VETLRAAAALAPGAARPAVEAVLRREAENSTALLDIGAGVPHARLAGLDGTLVALAVSPPGLYEAVPTVPIRIVALGLSPPDSRTDHLNTLTEIATLLRSPELRAALLAARDGDEALAALRAHAGPGF
jgi:mannitol/fructose-specific phosphotransferase system IIA component (Ntr-type)